MSKPRISFEDALLRVHETVVAGPIEVRRTALASGRILARPAVARRDCPPFDMSAMDGYAIGLKMSTEPGERHLSIGSAQFAGDTMWPLAEDEARPIFTGAAVPDGTASILVQEQASVIGATLVLSKTLEAGSNIRCRGEDAEAGEQVLDAPTRLNPAMIGALTAFGVNRVDVRARPRVAVLVLGDELSDSESIADHLIVDANGPMITAMLQEVGCIVEQPIGVQDDTQAIAAALQAAMDSGADIVVCTGGASVGVRDLLRPSVDVVGATIHFHGAHMRPGKPVLYATSVSGVPIFGLPGNPVAALVGARFFVMAAIRTWYAMKPEQGITFSTDQIKPGPTRVLKAFSSRIHSDIGTLQILPGQQSHMMKPLLNANMWLVEGGNRPAMLFSLFDSLDAERFLRRQIGLHR